MFQSTKNFVIKHERKIIIGTAATATGLALLMLTGLKQHNQFLKDNGLYETFYTLSEE